MLHLFLSKIVRWGSVFPASPDCTSLIIFYPSLHPSTSFTHSLFACDRSTFLNSLSSSSLILFYINLYFLYCLLSSCVCFPPLFHEFLPLLCLSQYVLAISFHPPTPLPFSSLLPSLPPSLLRAQTTDWTLPECFSDHILVGDAVVGQGFAPHGVERVMQRLGAKFIGLEEEEEKENKWQSWLFHSA